MAGMGKLARETLEHLKDVAWAVFLLYLVLAGLALIFGREVGYATMAWICLGFALLITVVFAAISAVNLVGVVLYRAFKRLGIRNGSHENRARDRQESSIG
jgi:hypothetical protein